MNAATVVEIVLIAAVFIGLPIMCWIDPSGHHAAEVKRRQSS